MGPDRLAVYAPEPASTVQKGDIFEAEIIVLCVRWCLRFDLSFRNLEEIMAERNLPVDHVTICSEFCHGR
jgi:transposase-like protein